MNKFIRKIILADEDENYWDLIIFETEVNLQEVKKVIKKSKENNVGTWNLESIEKDLEKNFGMIYVELFDYTIGNYININEEIEIEENK